MSAISPVSAQVSSTMTFSSGAVGGTGANAATATGDVGSSTGALGLQSSMMLQQAGGLSNVDQLAALALMLLLNKGNDSQKSENDNAWKMLAMMALMSGLGQQGQTTCSLSQTVGDASAVYAAGGAAPAPSVNLQG